MGLMFALSPEGGAIVHSLPRGQGATGCGLPFGQATNVSRRPEVPVTCPRCLATAREAYAPQQGPVQKCRIEMSGERLSRQERAFVRLMARNDASGGSAVRRKAARIAVRDAARRKAGNYRCLTHDHVGGQMRPANCPFGVPLPTGGA